MVEETFPVPGWPASDLDGPTEERRPRRAPTLIQSLKRGLLGDPHKPLIIREDDGMTYEEAWRGVHALAWYFRRECHVEQGSYVALCASNDLEVPIILGAIQLCGADAIIVPPGLSRGKLTQYISLVRIRLFISSSEEECAFVASMGCLCKTALITRSCSSPGLLDEALSRFPLDQWGAFPADSRDCRIVLFSSGSTGSPKAIVNRASSVSLSAQYLSDPYPITDQDVLYVPVPFSHVFGIVAIYMTLNSVSTMVTSLKYRPETALALIERNKATIHLGVATMYLRELRANEDNAWDLSSLRAGLVAGASTPESVFVEFERRYGCPIIQSYGMTETSATLTVSSLDLPVMVRAHRVGVPIEGARIKLDPSTDEILCKTPLLMEGILRSDGSCVLDLEDGWFRTGDVGAFDEAGRLNIVGRIKDIVIRGGINIFPAEVEGLYRDCPGVAESYLVGYPDPELGERTCLCVLMADGVTTSELDLRAFAIGRIEKCRVPDTVMKMSDFPRLVNGKIDKNMLRVMVKRAIGA